MASITIPARFNGPPDSANGGVTCGLVAALLPAGVEPEVTLRSPPPLDTALSVERSDGAVLVRDGESLVAEATPGTFDLAIPDPPSAADARAAMAGFPGKEFHFFPTCFVCGTAREPGDGLRIHPGPLAGRDDLAAAIWEPTGDHCDEHGAVRDEILWGALDCPSAWTWRGDLGSAIVLGRLTVTRRAPVRCGEEITVLGWPVATEGRKFIAGTALFGPDGDLRAASKAVWIEVAG